MFSHPPALSNQTIFSSVLKYLQCIDGSLLIFNPFFRMLEIGILKIEQSHIDSEANL